MLGGLLKPNQDRVPALIESIKTAGLVLVSDISDSATTVVPQGTLGVARPSRDSVPSGVDGYLQGNGVLRFNESVDL